MRNRNDVFERRVEAPPVWHRGAGRKPDNAETRAELRRILQSRCFEQAGRLAELLRFVVDETLAGRGGRLKGYSIGVRAFGRPADFDPQADPLVRIEAGRLRRRLAEYYAGEGANDPVRIALPRGGYAVECTCLPHDRAPVAAAEPAAAARWPRAVAVLALLLVAAFGVIVWQQRQLLQTDQALDVLGPPVATDWPHVVVVPFENLSAEPKLADLAAIMTDEVMLALDQLDLFVVAGQTPWYGPSSAADVAKMPGSYLLTGSVRGDVGRARITARLIEAETGQQLWTSSYDEPPAFEQLPALQERVARDVAAIGAPYGPIFEAELKRAQIAQRTPELRDCLAKYYDYRRRVDVGAYADALLCLESVSAHKPRVAQVWAVQAMLHLDSYAYHFGDGGAEALTAARDATAKALALDADDFLANMAIVRVQFFDGDSRFREGIERTLALRPGSAEALAQGGLLLAVSGDSAAGLPLIERARALSKTAPGIYNVAYAVTYLRAGQFEQALNAALKIDTPDWIVAHALVAATAALSGRRDLAEEAAGRLRAIYPEFEAEALRDFEKWHFDPEYQAQFVAGLRAAGLDLAGPKARHP